MLANHFRNSEFVPSSTSLHLECIPVHLLKVQPLRQLKLGDHDYKPPLLGIPALLKCQ